MKVIATLRAGRTGMLFALCLLLTMHRSAAQSVTSYAFSASTGTFTALSGATAPGLSSGTTDDGRFVALPIGFDFWYMGSRYTTVSASTNGWLALGSTITDAYTNNLATGGARPLLAPLWDDLNIVSGSNVSYRTTGAVGSRVFTLQYLNAKWDYVAWMSGISFQVRLYETSGRIEYVYRQESGTLNNASASIGLTAAGTGSGTYLSVNNAGTSASSTLEQSVTSKPVSGRTYAFTPPVPAAPTNLSFTAVSGSGMTLNWTDNASNETGYVVYVSTDGINYAFAAQLPAGAMSSVRTGLTNGIVYYWRVYAVTEGGLSAPVSGNQLTGCTGPAISQVPAGSLMANYRMEGTAIDATGGNAGTFQGTPAAAADRFGNAGRALSFTGTQYISTSNTYTNPGPFSVSIWFRTTTTTGGALAGFAAQQTGTGGFRDRFLYMTGSGTLYFCVAPGAVKKYISTAASYNDGNWHHVTASIGSGGMKLYVDGSLAAADAAVTTAEATTGYWRIAHSDLATWPSEPANYFFEGVLDDAFVYHRELSAAEVAILYNSPEGAGSNAPVCAGSTLGLTATAVSGASYSWTGPNGFVSALQNPSFQFNAAAAGVYTLQVSSPGCAAVSTAYVRVAASPTAGQWTGNVSSDWNQANNWCDGVVPTAAVNVVIAAGAANMPQITGTASCRNLTIASGAALTTAATGTLQLAGNLSNSGTMTNNGTTVFNGNAGQQTFAGVSVFQHLTVSNSSGLLLPAATTVNGNLSLAAGVLNANNFNLTVRGNWSNNASATSLAAGTATVTFSGTAAQSLGGTFATTFNNVTVNNPGNAVSLAQSVSIGGNLSVNGGTFDLAGFTANRVAAGGNLSVANNATLRIGGTNGFPANYSNVNLVVASTVEYGGVNQPVAAQQYGNLKLSSSSGAAVKTFPAGSLTVLGNLLLEKGDGTAVSATAAADMTVNGNVAIGAATTFNGGTAVCTVGGNWNNAGTFNGNSGTVVFAGAGASVGGGGLQNFNNLTVAAASVSFAAPSLSLTGNLATTGSGSFSQAQGGLLSMSGAGRTISGSGMQLQDLTISGSISTTAALAVGGNMNVSGSFTAVGGSISMIGTGRSIAGAGTIQFGVLNVPGSIGTASNFSIASSLNVSGSFQASAGTATFTGASSLSGTANLYHVTVNGTSLQLTANATLGIAGALTISAGQLDVVSSVPNTVNFNAAGTQAVNGITYHHLLLSNGGTKTAAAPLTAANLTIGSGTTFAAGSHLHTCTGNWLNNGVFVAGAGSVRFAGSSNSTISGPTTFNQLNIAKDASALSVSLQSRITAATVNMMTGTLLTGQDTIVITGTRTGNGIMLGNIQRTHAFASGTAYAFEGPQNTITFASLSGVSSVIVSVVRGDVVDFPYAASVKRVYRVAMPPAAVYNATLRLHYEDEELSGNDPANIQLWQYSGSVWSPAGRTGADSSLRYVERSGITNLQNRWTLSDNSNVVQWNGSISSAWEVPGNWTVVEGAASTPPGPLDIVDLGTAAFNHHPVISSAVSIKGLTFGSVQGTNLSLNSGGSLQISGTLDGSWSANAIHSINVNSQSLTVGGDISLSDGPSTHAIHLNIGSGSVTTLGSLTQSGGAKIVFSGAGSLTIHDNFNRSGGQFTAGNGTVIYNGFLNQKIGAVGYHHLTISKTGGVASVDSPLSVGGNLAVTAGMLNNVSTATVAGHVQLSAGAVLSNPGVLNVGGNWLNNGTFNGAGGSVYINGADTQVISATTFSNLIINKPVGSFAYLTGNVTLENNLTFVSGTVDIKSFLCSRTVAGGSATVGNAATVIMAGLPPANFSTVTLAPASTVVFNGTTPQSLVMPGVVLGNAIFRNGGTKTLARELSVAGNLTIESGSNLNAGNHTITLQGNWANGGNFQAGGSTLVLAGALKVISGTTTFNRVVIPGTYSVVSDITYDSLLYITQTGSITSGGSVHTTMNGDLLNLGILNTSGTTTFTGQRLQTLSLINATTFALHVNFNGSIPPVLNSTSVPQFGYLHINNTGGISPSLGWNIAYELSVGPGAAFHGGIATHTISGNVYNSGTISSSGILNFNPTAAATLDLGTGFSSTGTVVFGGSGAVTMAGAPAAFNNVLVSNTHPSGISPSSGWNVGNNLTIGLNSIFHAGGFTDTVRGNLLNRGTLDAGTSTIVLAGGATQEITSASSFNNLLLKKSGGVARLLTDITVQGHLGFASGRIRTDSHKVALGATATVTGASQGTGWVDGNFEKYIGTGAVSRSFEVGDSSTYAPAELAFGNVSAAGWLILSTVSGDHPDIASSSISASRSVNRTWNLSGNGTGFGTYSGTFHFRPSDVDAGASPAAFGAAIYNGSAWMRPAVTAAAPTSTQFGGATAFGAVAVGEICNAGTAIVYTGSPYCGNAGLAQVSRSGTGGGSYTSTAGLSLDATTGAVDLGASTPGTYTVTYRVAATGDCPVFTTSAVITVTKPSFATIIYPGSPYFYASGAAVVSQSGTAGGRYTAPAGLALDSLTGTVNLMASTAGTYTVIYTLPAAGGCSAYAATTGITIVTHKTWDGGAGTPNWSHAANWHPDGVPAPLDDVLLNGADTIQVDVQAAVRNLTASHAALHLSVDSGALLSLRDLAIPAGTVQVGGGLRIAGSISNAGVLAAENGSVEFDGISQQHIPAGAFRGNVLRNLTVTNNAGLVLDSALRLSGTLLVQTGQLQTGGHLTLLSTAERTALIDGSGSGAVLGNVTVQRYLTSAFGYRYFSSPVQAATVSEFGDDMNLGEAFPTFYRFDENLSSNGWVRYTDSSAPLTILQGYAANVDSVTTSRTFDITGVVNNGPLTSQVLTNHNRTYTAGFNLVGNPYPSPVDWDLSAGWSRSNIDDAIYYFDAGTADRYLGTYSSYINGVSSNGIAGSIIPSMQGFFVHVSDGAYPVSGSLGINNGARVNTLNPVFHRGGQPERPLLRLQAGFSGQPADELAVYFEQGATPDFDKRLDALKIMNTDARTPSLYALASGAQRLSIDALPEGTASDEIIPLGLSLGQGGEVVFEASTLDALPAGLQAYFYDAQTGTSQPLALQAKYRVQLEKGDHNNRFFLAFGRSGEGGPAGLSQKAFTAGASGHTLRVNLLATSGGKGELMVTNPLGQQLFRQTLSGFGLHEFDVAWVPGVYIVSFAGAQGTHSQKIFIGNP